MLKKQKLLVSLISIVVIFVSVPLSIKLVFNSNGEKIENDNQDVNEVETQFKLWNSGVRSVRPNSLIARFLPKYIDDDLLKTHKDDVFVYKKNYLTDDKNLDFYNQNQDISDFRVILHDKSLLKNGIEIDYKISNKDDDFGHVHLDFFIKKNNYFKKLVIPIQGFYNTDLKTKNDVLYAKDLIYRKLSMNPGDDLKQILPPTDKYDLFLKVRDDSDLKDVLPSKISEQINGALDKKEFEILGIDPPGKSSSDDYTDFVTHTADVHYYITKYDDQKGEIIITAYISKENKINKAKYEDELEISIGGFRTEFWEDEQEINDLINSLKTTQTTTLSDFYPTWDLSEKVNSFKLGIDEIVLKNGKVSYELLNINQEEGTIKVKVNFFKRKSTGNLEITINGYRNKWKYEVDESLKLINDQITEKTSQIPNWTVKDKVNFEDLGIKSFEIPYQVDIDYQIINVNKILGEVNIEVKVKNQGAYGNKIITIRGFKNYEQIFEQITQNVSDVEIKKGSPLSDKLPNEINDLYKENLTSKQLEELNINQIKSIPEEIKLIYKIIDINDDSGEITVELKISVENLNQTLTFKVKGFQNQNQRNKIIFNDFYQKLFKNNNLTEDQKNINLSDKSNYRFHLPSKINLQVGETIRLNNLIDFNLILPEKNQVEVEAKVVEINDDEGLIKISLKIKLGENYKEVVININGFRKKNEQDVIDVKNLKSYLEDQYKDVRIQDNSIYKNLLPSEIKEKLKSENLTEENIEFLGIKIIAKNILKHAIVNYKIVNINDGSGQIGIETEIVQGEFVDSFIFQIKGFQTQNQRNQIEVNQALTKFKKDNPNLDIDPKNDLANKTISELGYKVGNVLSDEQIKKMQFIINNENFDLEWEFTIKKIDETNGILDIELTITKGFAKITEALIIKGFKPANFYY